MLKLLLNFLTQNGTPFSLRQIFNCLVQFNFISFTQKMFVNLTATKNVGYIVCFVDSKYKRLQELVDCTCLDIKSSVIQLVVIVD